MRTTINHALDLLEEDESLRTSDKTSDKTSEKTINNGKEIIRVVKRVQEDYLEIIETALSLLIQQKEDESKAYLREERQKLIATKERIAALISSEERWPDSFHRAAIEYLYTRARLVDEIRMFPNIALELLDRPTLDQSLAETINYLENAMTGKRDLLEKVINAEPGQ